MDGNPRVASVILISTESTHPRAYPASKPTAVPIKRATIIEGAVTISTDLHPKTNLAVISLPRISVPKICLISVNGGICLALRSLVIGSPTMKLANNPQKSNKNRIVSAIHGGLWSFIHLRTACPRVNWIGSKFMLVIIPPI